MAALRVLALSAALGLLAFTGFAVPTVATEEPNVGCGGTTVELCFPVCVTEPCYGYVCVHYKDQAEICRQLG